MHPIDSKFKINSAHFQEWEKGSGIDPKRIENSIESVDDAVQIATFLSWKSYSGASGYFIYGYDLKLKQFIRQQFKPDQPVIGREGKSAKYLTSKDRLDADSYDAILLPGYDWEKTAIDQSLVIITEGAKKGGALLDCGFAAIALCGVEMWHKSQSLAWVPNLKRTKWSNRPVVICFDADLYEKKPVFAALKKLGRKLLQNNAEVKVATWDPALGKGIDDVLVAHGKEKVAEIIENAEPFQDFIQRIEVTEKPDGVAKLLPPRALAAYLYEEFREKWAYDLQFGTWRTWEENIWKKRHELVIFKLLKERIEKDCEYNAESYMKSVCESLKLLLLKEEWQHFDLAQWIAGKNGILDLDTGKVESHKPGFGFTSLLPHEVRSFEQVEDFSEILGNFKEHCPVTHKFFDQISGGKSKKILKLLAIIAGIIRFRFKHLQKFVHLIGEPGTGKGTFIRLLQALVGKENHAAASLTNLKDGNVMARILDAQLVVFPDERKSVGVEWILKLVGGDSIDFRKVFTAGGSKPFDGSLIIASNSPIFVGDTEGIDRRLCLIPFDKKVTNRDPSLNEKLEQEIPDLVAQALSLPLSSVDNLISGTEKVENTMWYEWQMKIESCKVASFVDDALVMHSNSSVSAGDLFNSYLQWSKIHNHTNPGSSTFFGTRIKQHLNWLNLDWTLKKSNGRKAYLGFKIRESWNEAPLLQDHFFENRDSSTVPRDSSGTVTGTVSIPCPDWVRDSRDSYPPIKLENQGGENNFDLSQPSTLLRESCDSLNAEVLGEGDFQKKNDQAFQEKRFTPKTIPTVPNPDISRETTVPATVPELSLNCPQLSLSQTGQGIEDFEENPSTVPIADSARDRDSLEPAKTEEFCFELAEGMDVLFVTEGEFQGREGIVQSVYKHGVVKVRLYADPENKGFKFISADCLAKSLVPKKELKNNLNILTEWLRHCDSWEQVQEAVAFYPYLKTQAWDQLKNKERIRLKSLKRV